jgi:hypothetical protein
MMTKEEIMDLAILEADTLKEQAAFCAGFITCCGMIHDHQNADLDMFDFVDNIDDLGAVSYMNITIEDIDKYIHSIND